MLTPFRLYFKAKNHDDIYSSQAVNKVICELARINLDLLLLIYMTNIRISQGLIGGGRRLDYKIKITNLNDYDF